MEISITLLKDIGDALKAASDALNGVIKALTVAASSSTAGYDQLALRHERRRLIALSAHLTNLGSEYNVRVVDSLDAYVAKQQPTLQDWQVVVQALQLATKEVTEILADLKKERSEFVLHPAYVELSTGLHARTQLLEKLMLMEPPTQPEALQGLTVLSEQYKMLIIRLRETVNAMNSYLGEEYYNTSGLSDKELLKHVE